ncbi:ead/Ea22-like family protein [Leclercia adecarboxylata ATCC 23216 = NBRC 102595]|nr:ead/Ea22-like family protein [Leclercia adecarboxylata ATCC 23216 = NBRC 102595]
MTINKQALRERYSEKPAPKCHICGAVMTIQRAGSGGVVYGCTGRIDRDGEGYKFEDGRDFADDHYARSRVTDYSPSGDPDVLALLDELEAAEKRIAEYQKSLNRAQTLLSGSDPENSWETIARLKVVISCDYRSQAEIDAAGISIKGQ